DAVVVGGQEGEGIHRILRCRDGGGCGGGIGCGPPVTGSGLPRCGGADLGGQLGPSSTWRAASSAAGGTGSASTSAAPPPSASEVVCRARGSPSSASATAWASSSRRSSSASW